MSVTKTFKSFIFILVSVFIFIPSGMAAMGKQPITVNGDTVEFKSENGEMVAEGNVEIINQNTKLTCDKVRVFINEKLAIAEGHIKLTKPGAQELRGEMIIFDFGSQTGTIVDAQVHMALPFTQGQAIYTKAQALDRISDDEFTMSDANLTTCDLPHPHYNMQCREIHMQPDSILTARGVKASILGVPLMYLPVFSQLITDKRPRFMIIPGHRKNFGTYALGSWRYYLGDNVRGLLHLDWYQKRGWGQGVDVNYDTKLFGMGNAKYYHILDSDPTNASSVSSGQEAKDRSHIEVRHKWDISPQDHVVMDFFRDSDATMRHDFFYREYDRETNPQSFLLYSHLFPMATFSFLEQPRVNTFDTMLEKKPELRLETINQKIGQTSFYFKDITTASNLYNATANVSNTSSVSRVDTVNQLSYIFRFVGLDFDPFVGYQNTYYSRGSLEKNALTREMFFTGMDVSTKFFKIYDTHSNLWNLNIDQLRHVVTPSIQYRYQQEPSVDFSRLQQFDTIDTLERENMITFGLENKLQTKRGGVSVDLMTLYMTSDYDLERNATSGKGFQNLKYRFEFTPYPGYGFTSDAEYDTADKFFRTLDANFWVNIGKTQAVLGYDQAKGANGQMTASFTTPLNPFWKLNIYERFDVVTGILAEQQYILDRDLHCWTMEFIIDQTQGNGVSFLVAFKLKAFPSMSINARETFAPPRTQGQ